LIPPYRDIEQCKKYLSKVHEYIAAINDLQEGKEFDSRGSSLSDGMPRGTTISNKTMHEALDNVDIDYKIRNIQRKLNKRRKNILRIIDKIPNEDETIQKILSGMFVLGKQQSLIQREIGASNETFPLLLTQAYKTYTYYFYRSKQARRG